MKLSRKQYGIVAGVSLLCIIIIALVAFQTHQHDVQNQRAKALLNAKVYSDEVNKDFQRGIAITDALKAVVMAEKGEIDDFDAVAQGMMEDYIGSIQLAPGGVVSEIYPLEGNEAGKLDLLHDQDRGPVARYSKDRDVITMQGPFNLAQGGKGLAIRNPVYLSDEKGNPKFWGFTIVIIKAPEIFEPTLNALESFGYDYSLETTTSPLSRKIERVSASVPDGQALENPEANSFEAGGCIWSLEVLPKADWKSNRMIMVLVGGFVIGLLLVLMTCMILSLSNQKRRLGELAEAAESASAAKTAFISNMAHDLRTPLNAVMGLSQLARNHMLDKERMSFYLSEINVAGKQLLGIINNILEISRIESDKVEIEEELTDTYEMYEGLRTIFLNQAKAKNLTFNFTKNIKHRYLYLDKTHVEEVLVNLLSNAMKYTPEGGTIDAAFIELEGDSKDKTTIQAIIKDNGIGMSEEYQAKLFQNFEREKSDAVKGIQGSGLGLSIVKNLVDMMGGNIEIESKQNVGTRIIVDLTHRIGQEPAGVESVDSIDKESFVGKRVLLVEDNEINAVIAEEILTTNGFLVEKAVNGSECLDMVRAASGGYYDLILMDIQMPVMDGYEAAAAIRSLADKDRAGTPIIAMTANAFREDRMKAIEHGMNSHVAKPIDMKEFLTTLSKVLAYKNYYVYSAELKAFRERYEAAGHKCGYFVYRANNEAALRFADPATASIFGCLTVNEFKAYVNSSFNGMVHPADLDKINQQIYEQQKESDRSIDDITYRIIRKDGEIRKVRDMGYRTFDGSEMLFYVYIADVTDGDI